MVEKKPNNIPLAIQPFVCSNISSSNIKKGKFLLKPFDINERPKNMKNNPTKIWTIFKILSDMADRAENSNSKIGVILLAKRIVP